MIKEILTQIKDAQALQDAEGHEHPGLTQVFSFPAPWLVRFWLKLKAIKGLTFEYYNNEWYGIYRAQK